MGIPIIGAIIPAVLRALGGVVRKQATKIGTAGLVTAVVARTVAVPLLGGIITSENVVDLVRIAADVLIALFSMIASFGVGRKAGATPDYRYGPAAPVSYIGL